MNLTLLLDLDDTLLSSDMDNFIPVYFRELEKAMSKYVPAELTRKYLWLGTQAMIENDSPAESLEAAFSRNFYPHLGTGRDILDPLLADFYQNIFPKLASLTTARPEAVEFVKWAFAQGYKIAISTNPLFPQAAIYERLRWAGLAPEDYPFAVISTFETFHYSKPNPAYFAEVLAQTGWGDTPVLVVGDDPERDLRAAQKLGLARYWVADDDKKLPDGVKEPEGRGSIGALRGWLEAQEDAMFRPAYQAKNAIVATLKAIPAAMMTLLSDLSTEGWAESPNSDEWSLVEVLSHLRDVEREVNLPRIQTFLKEESPFIRADDTDLWAAERSYASGEGVVVLQEFLQARLDTLSAIKKLNSADWQRAGRHAIFGPITLQEQLGFTAEHDRVHWRQIYALLR